MDFRRTKYILPNLFTFASICAGMYSIHLSTGAQSISEFSLAAWLLVVAMVCDAFDGRVARMTRTESELGIQLDSLADTISFGVAPAFLLYHWGLEAWGSAGLLVVSVYAACAVLRLGRFNVLSARGDTVESKKYFVGLPTPLAAGAVVAMVLGHVSHTGAATTEAAGAVAAICIVLSVLMVSTVPYRTFKDVELRGAAWAGIAVLAVAAVVSSLMLEPIVTFAGLMGMYIGLGIVIQTVQTTREFVGDETNDGTQPVNAMDGDVRS